MMQNSPNQQDQDQDQRKDSSMEDSTAMTIEFLRARLLSERSVSRTAKQRADELAKRVVELEEQLKLVSLLRKKAEKATTDVLAILENHGISEFSEEFDSSSDQEVSHCESKVGNNSMKEEESSVTLKERRNYMDQFSGSELESSTLRGRSLSWKNGKGFPHSREKKYMNSSTRRRSSFASIGSASPKRVGKSCRQIGRRETRSAVEELQIDTSMHTPQDNGDSTCSEGFPNCSDIGSEVLRVGSENQAENLLLEGPGSEGLESQRDVTSAGIYLNENGCDKDMESALEHQAQLIGKYEAEERAQREWEEKFGENNSSTPDSCEPGNHSDVTEERDEIKAPAPPSPAGTISSQDQEAKSKMGDVCFTKESSKSHPNGFQPPPSVDMGCLQDKKYSSHPSGFQPPPNVDTGSLQDKKCSSMLASESTASEFAFPIAKGNQIKECSESCSPPPPHSSHHNLLSQGSLGNQAASDISSSHAGSSSRNGEEKQRELMLMPHDTSDKLGSVLEALQKAKLSLNHKLNQLPLIEGGSVGKAIEASVPAIRVGDRVEVPVGCAGLFRVPSDFQFEATRANFLGSGSRLSLTNYYPDTAFAPTAGERFITSPFMESKPSVSTDNQFLNIPSSQYMESRSRVSTGKPFFEPRLDVGVPSSSGYISLDPNLDTGVLSSRRFANPTYPFYPDLMPRMPYSGGLSRPFSTGETGMPPADRFSFYDDHTKPNTETGIRPVNRFSFYGDHNKLNLETGMRPVNHGFSFYDDHNKPNLESGIPPANHFPFYDDHNKPNMYR
uniref:Uncharacterized protein n=1 Tax=Davidia involucrata TaxID=16924 RepID=A0A5B6ZW33_DAVIN